MVKRIELSVGATYLLIFLASLILAFGIRAVIKNHLLPQCPNCEKAIFFDYCSNCGWENPMDTSAS